MVIKKEKLSLPEQFGEKIRKRVFKSETEKQEFARQRKHQIDLMKLQQKQQAQVHKQKMEYLRLQQEQIANSQDPRFQPSSDDQFLNEQDPEHEFNIQTQQQQQYNDYLMQNYPEYSTFTPKAKRNYLKEFMNTLSRAGQNLSNLAQRRAPYSLATAQYQQNQYNAQPFLKANSNILNASKNTGIHLIKPSNFSSPSKLSLMNSETTKPRASLKFTTAPRIRTFSKYKVGGLKD